MGSRLKYDSTRLLFIGFILIVAYCVVLPGRWPRPMASVEMPQEAALGTDIPLKVSVSAWHPNFSIRQVSISMDSVKSTALSVSRPVLPVNIVNHKPPVSWSVDFGGRLSYPRKVVLDLVIPLAKISKDLRLKPGDLLGSVHVVVDHTRITIDGTYPALSSEPAIPYTLHLR